MEGAILVQTRKATNELSPCQSGVAPLRWKWRRAKIFTTVQFSSIIIYLQLSNIYNYYKLNIYNYYKYLQQLNIYNRAIFLNRDNYLSSAGTNQGPGWDPTGTLIV